MANQYDIEAIACQEFETQVALGERPQPEHRRNYFFRALLCQNRDEGVWIRCIHKDADREEEVLVGREATDEDLRAFIEERWQMRLSVAAIKRPLVTNQEAVFKRRVEDENEEEAEIDLPIGKTKEEQWRPPIPSTPVVSRDDTMHESIDEATHMIIECPCIRQASGFR
jgi:hypothetical protein